MEQVIENLEVQGITCRANVITEHGDFEVVGVIAGNEVDQLRLETILENRKAEFDFENLVERRLIEEAEEDYQEPDDWY